MTYPTYKHDKCLAVLEQLEGKTIKKVVTTQDEGYILTEDGYLIDFLATTAPYESDPLLAVNQYQGCLPYNIAFELGFISKDDKDKIEEAMHNANETQQTVDEIRTLEWLLNKYPQYGKVV